MLARHHRQFVLYAVNLAMPRGRFITWQRHRHRGALLGGQPQRGQQSADIPVKAFEPRRVLLPKAIQHQG
jgi:hypothetical protein